MKYFLLGTNKNMMQIPQLLNWYEKIRIKDMDIKNSYKIPDRDVIFVKGGKDIIYPDIIEKPFFMVSEKTKKVIMMYEPKTIWKELILLDKENEKASRYFLPIFMELECLIQKSGINLNHSDLKRVTLNRQVIKEYNIFSILCTGKRYIVANLDVVESLLKRNLLGLDVRELNVEEEKYER